MVEDGEVVVVPGVVLFVSGVPFGDRWVREFPFILPLLPVLDGLVLSG